MKVIKSGNRKTWSAKLECTGIGFGDSGCGAVLELEKDDIIKYYPGPGQAVRYGFVCPECSVRTQIALDALGLDRDEKSIVEPR
jgi:hypothetical protein